MKKFLFVGSGLTMIAAMIFLFYSYNTSYLAAIDIDQTATKVRTVFWIAMILVVAALVMFSFAISGKKHDE